MVTLPPNIRAVFFDLNGTLIRDRIVHYQAFTELFLEYGIVLNNPDYEAKVTNRLNRDIWRNVFGAAISEVDMSALSAVKERRYLALLGAKDRVVPGGLTLIRTIRSMGKKVGLVTTAPASVVEHILPLVGLHSEDFDVVVCGSDISHGKPDPECYLTAFAAAGVTASQVAVFEDSPQGVTAAMRAGANLLVGVLPEYSAQELQECGVQVFITSFDEVKVG